MCSDVPVCTPEVEPQSEVSFSGSPSKEKSKPKLKMPRIWKKGNAKKHPKADIPDHPAIQKSLDFNQNLAQNHLAEASQQLIAREALLFNPQSSEVSAEVNCTEDEEDSLHKDYETLMLHLRMAVSDPFNKENQERLKSAVKAILQEEEQDRQWEEVAEKKCPYWRPLKCKEIHDTLLKEVVEVRLQQANEEENGADNLSTSLKREVCRMGRRIQKDLLNVVRDVQQCYTSEFDICKMYVQLYHQAFSTKLREFARTNIELQDCIYILCWIHCYYPKDIVQHKELVPHINTESLGALLPEEDHKSLEEQYLSHKEIEIRTWLSNALKKEEEIWQTDSKPDCIDGFYFSNLALDVIPIINGAMKETVDILGDKKHAQRILLQLQSFLERYKKSTDDLLKGRHSNISDSLKASLFSIRQLRDYIEKHENLSEEVKGNLLSIVSEMRNSCHTYFLSLIHKDLKEQYRKLWTPAWFSERQKVTGDLLNILEEVARCFSDLESACMTELLGQLHFEVMIEYVKRMLKGKVKLKDKDDQEAAARFLLEDSTNINCLFDKIGSKEKWLSQILSDMSEVLRLQDPGALQLEIVTLARKYPDISECQVLALLNLKTNLSKADVRSIKKSLTENRGSQNAEPTTAFFCKVAVKRKLMTVFLQ